MKESPIKNLIDLLVNYTTNSDKYTQQEEYRSVRAFILVWTSTVVIMWFYVLFSYSVFDFSTVGNIGLVCTILHTLTPTIYRHSKSLVLAGLNISLTALIFQITFCIFNGGIDSPSAIWFTAHPVIISYFASKRLILLSVFLNMVAVLGLTFIGNSGYFPVDTLTKNFTDWMRISSLIFLDIIIATYTIVFMNTTKQNEIELSKRNELIENLMRIISHDINNALTVSTLSTRLLENKLKEDEPAITESINMIKKSNNQIIEISKSIQEWMKTNDNSMNLNILPLGFREVEKHISESFTPILEAKSISLEMEIEPKVTNKTKILVDSGAFRNQVLNNIISNAIKFSSQGEKIFIKASIENKFIKITIKDQGIGIPENIMDDIFDPSKSTSRLGTGGERGTGFGMPIVKELIEQMNGIIHIESIVKNEKQNISGTTMTIYIPLA
jgi:signal transduction histidine kinase